jgi:hypothetical protein
MMRLMCRRAAAASNAALGVLLLLAMAAAGCAGKSRLNPTLPVTIDQADAMIEAMEADPKPAPRPVLILGGYADIGNNRAHLDRRLQRMLGEDTPILGIAFPFALSYDGCRDKVLQRMQETFPSDDPRWTVEVDVVAFSMGGLIARYAALPPATSTAPNDLEPRRRLKIARLFTVSTPHQGAELAKWPHYDAVIRDMKPGSEFLQQLDAHLPEARYTIIPYVRLGDGIVGEENAAPDGRVAWWVDPPPVTGIHMYAHRDPRIVADIARRLRGEAPLTTEPPAPLPE